MLEIKPTTFSHNKTHFLLSGMAGDIEVTTTSPKNISQPKVIIICHPHPLHGGTMDNKVVTTLIRTFNELGFKQYALISVVLGFLWESMQTVLVSLMI